MGAQRNNSSAEQDWRLEAELDVEQPHGALHALVGRFRGPDVSADVAAVLPPEVVLTHDGRMLFVYAASEAALASARSVIEETLRRDGVGATIRISHWDDERDRWRQVDPPPSDAERAAQEAAARADKAIETRTLVASAGKVVRSEFEQEVRAAASALGLQCTIAEHRHLLTTQVAFTVTGERRKVEEFARDLKSQGVAMLRTDEWLVASPL